MPLQKIILNVNFPNIPNPRGIKVTHLGERVYKDFISTGSTDGTETVTITGDDPGFNNLPGSDLNAVSEGFVSVCPLANEITERKLLDKISFLEQGTWKKLG